MIIYKVTNSINQKIYIGSTTQTLSIRRSQHLSAARRYTNTSIIFHKALRKYGKENFTWEIIDESATNINTLHQLEHKYISEYKSYGEAGYNLTYGFDNTTLGYKFSEEYKASMRIKMKGSSNPNFGNNWSAKQKKVASERQKKVKALIDPITGENIAKRPDIRLKISETKLGLQNPNAALWKLVDPLGNIFMINGGIKREIKKYKLNYQQFNKYGKKQEDGSIKNKKGWLLYKLEKNS